MLSAHPAHFPVGPAFALALFFAPLPFRPCFLLTQAAPSAWSFLPVIFPLAPSSWPLLLGRSTRPLSPRAHASTCSQCTPPPLAAPATSVRLLAASAKRPLSPLVGSTVPPPHARHLPCARRLRLARPRCSRASLSLPSRALPSRLLPLLHARACATAAAPECHHHPARAHQRTEPPQWLLAPLPPSLRL